MVRRSVRIKKTKTEEEAMLGLKGLFWNSEGLCDPNKHIFIQEMIMDERLDFIALSEAGRSNFATLFLNHLASGIDFSWFCLPPHGRSGGMLVGFNCATLQVKNVIAGDFSLIFHLR